MKTGPHLRLVSPEHGAALQLFVFLSTLHVQLFVLHSKTFSARAGQAASAIDIACWAILRIARLHRNRTVVGVNPCRRAASALDRPSA